MGQPALHVLGHVSPKFLAACMSNACLKGPLEAAQGYGGKAAGRAYHETVQGKRAAPSKN